MAKTRRIPFTGAPNFRDMGGYPVTTGGTTRFGLVYRADDLSELDTKDAELFAQLGIRTVVDFRTRSEQNYSPDVLPEEVNVVSIPIDAGQLLGNFYGGTLNRKKTTGIMISVYKQLACDFIPFYHHFFQALQENGALPLLFHCTAGKDRTGFAAALFLSALGVARNIIIGDYVYSNECLKERYTQGVDYDDSTEPLYIVQPEFIQAALDIIDTHFGGMDAYLTEQLGVDLVRCKQTFIE